jgi:serine/threonine-protein kinase
VAEQRFGKYRLIKLIASGGMGEVFLARQEGPHGVQKLVVIKRILKTFAAEPTFQQMFLNEARVAAQLRHPNVAQIFELGQEQGTHFIAMEFIHGRTLREVEAKLKERGLDFPATYAARITAAVLQGLHYAHTLKGEDDQPLRIIHRDVSPDNVMVGFDGSVKLLDFGIAKEATQQGTTKSGIVKGKFAYMSPERVDGKSIDHRTDIWSAGVMLYELVAGRRPFPVEEDIAALTSILTTHPPRLDQIAPDSDTLAPIVHRALEKNPLKRFPTAQLMAEALERYCTEAQVSLKDAETAAFMRGLYGDEATRDPALAPPGDHGALSRGAHHDPAGGEPGDETSEYTVGTGEFTVGTGQHAAGTGEHIGAREHAAGNGEHIDAGEPAAGNSEHGIESESVSGLYLSAMNPVMHAETGLTGGYTALARLRRKALWVGAIAAVMLLVVGVTLSSLGAQQPKTIAPPVDPIAALPAHEPGKGEAGPAPAEFDPSAPEPTATDNNSDATDAPRTSPAFGRNARGRVDLKVKPWAEVFEGKRSLGVTPLPPLELPVGKHVLTLKNAELSIERSVKVKVPRDGTVTVRVDLRN